ncbi:hypothetical protein [Tepidibacillus marianensis]|uniref:anti-sigma-I factor RsgI family protein n=1 Tax=Tepidibacillus marianensis TaxID=3131995 RepID=UPI0030CBD71E
MITRFKSALNQIKAEDELISKTEAYLKDSLAKNQSTKINKFIKWRLLPMKKRLAIATCLAVLLIGGGSGAYAYTQTPITYLSLDINPSVEIGVNTFGKVVKAEGYNNDGKKILNGINVKGSNVTEAVNILISSAVDNDFIAKDGSTVISLTSETDNENTATKLEIDAETGANEALKENGKTAVINKDNVSMSRREEARTLGITPGKLNLIKKLQSVDPNATVDQYKDASVKEIMKDIQNNTDNGNVNNKDEGAVNNTDNGNVNNKDKGTVNNTNNGNVNNKDKGAVNNTDNGNVNNKDKGTVENKKQNMDEGNKVNTTKSIKNDNVDNGSNSSDSGNNGNSDGNN